MSRYKIALGLIGVLCAWTPAAAQQAGNLLTLHVMKVHLKPGVRMEQFQDFFIHRVLPEYERQWPEIRAYMLRGRVHPGNLAVVWQFRSLAARDKYFTPGGKANALELRAREGVKPIEAELAAKYGTFEVIYTDDDDWIVQ